MIFEGADTQRMVSSGVVRWWSDSAGWGVVDGPDLPGGCWTHVSRLAVSGLPSLVPGAHVHLEWETPGQDGYDFRAVRVWPEGSEPALHRPLGASSAYQSTLTLTFDEPGSTVGLDVDQLVGLEHAVAFTRLVELRLQIRVVGPDEPVTLEHTDDRVTLVVEQGTVVSALAG